MASAPSTYDALAAHIAQRHDALSDRLRVIAEFAIQHPNEVALGTVSALSERIGVQPSAIVRFANSLGYDGFTEMQQVFRARLVAPKAPGYRERIAALRRGQSDGLGTEPADVLATFVADDISALEALDRSAPPEKLDRAITLLTQAQTIYSAAQGRSFPVAFYLDYALTRLDLRSHLLDSVGGLTTHRARAITTGDVLIAISFRDYSRDVIELAEVVAARGVPLIVITDNPLGPFAKIASVSFDLPEQHERAFRSLVAPVCLAQSLVVAVGHRLQGAANGQGGGR